MKKDFLLKDENLDSFKMHPVLVEAFTPQLDSTIENVNLLIKKVSDLLHFDETKDNPVDKFPYVPYGDALLKNFNIQSPEISTLANNLALRHQDLGEYEKAP